jgi:hypothetical protein
LWLYFLDHNAWLPEPRGIWIGGTGRADVIVRSAQPIAAFAVEIESPIATTVTLSAGGRPIVVEVPKEEVHLELEARGVRGPRTATGEYFYLLSAESSSRFVPSAIDPSNPDDRLLGAQLRFRPLDVASSPRQQEGRGAPAMR